jgi:hypothetical protein
LAEQFDLHPIQIKDLVATDAGARRRSLWRRRLQAVRAGHAGYAKIGQPAGDFLEARSTKRDCLAQDKIDQ